MDDPLGGSPMNTPLNNITAKPPRVVVTDHMRRHLIEDIMKDSVSDLAKRIDLPYMLIYNIVNRRVKSLSARHYRAIFGEDPPTQTQKKTAGTYFRQMVKLWLFLNDGITKSDLYRELFGSSHTRRVDYRIFTGQIQTIDPELIKQMEKNSRSAASISIQSGIG